MLQKLFVLTALLSVSSLFGQTGVDKAGAITGQTQTVQEVMNQAGSLQTVVLEGVLASQIDDKEYVFEDKTGRMRVKFAKSTLLDGYPIMKNTGRMSGLRVRISGLVEKKWSGNHKLRVNAIQILKS